MSQSNRVIYTFDGTPESGALWQNTVGDGFMQIHLANYERNDQGWVFTGIGARPHYIRVESLTSACADFLKRMGLVVQEKQIIKESDRPDLTKRDHALGHPFSPYS